MFATQRMKLALGLSLVGFTTQSAAVFANTAVYKGTSEEVEGQAVSGPCQVTIIRDQSDKVIDILVEGTGLTWGLATGEAIVEQKIALVDETEEFVASTKVDTNLFGHLVAESRYKAENPESLQRLVVEVRKFVLKGLTSESLDEVEATSKITLDGGIGIAFGGRSHTVCRNLVAQN